MFADEPPDDISDPRAADELASYIVRERDFFRTFDDASYVHAEVCRRYLPGLIEPRLVVPYLLVRLGSGAVQSSATALLRGRPELWPAFLRAWPAVVEERCWSDVDEIDHGTDLAHALSRHGLEIACTPPPEIVICNDLEAGDLRSWFGLQLRAWGEADLAELLCTVADERILAIRATQLKVSIYIAHPGHIAILFDELGVKRPPRRDAPKPSLYQFRLLTKICGRASRARVARRAYETVRSRHVHTS